MLHVFFNNCLFLNNNYSLWSQSIGWKVSCLSQWQNYAWTQRFLQYANFGCFVFAFTTLSDHIQYRHFYELLIPNPPRLCSLLLLFPFFMDNVRFVLNPLSFHLLQSLCVLQRVHKYVTAENIT